MKSAENILETFLAGADENTIVHLVYEAGREATPKAISESLEASDWKKPHDEYVGHFKSLRRAKNGDLVLTLWVHNRGEVGAFRSFNPNLGTLRGVFVRRT